MGKDLIMWNSSVELEIENENGTRITCTTLKTLKGMVDMVQKTFPEKSDEEIMLPFEFIIGSLFPTSYDALKKAMVQQYIDGYNCGKEEATSENSRTN